MKQDEPQHKPQSPLEALLRLERKESAPAGGVPRLKQEVPSPTEVRHRQKLRRRLQALQRAKDAQHALASFRAKGRWRRRLEGFPVAYETLVARTEPGTWYLSRELVPLMPEGLRRPRQCGYVIKRAFDYGLIEREELETKGRFESYW